MKKTAFAPVLCALTVFVSAGALAKEHQMPSAQLGPRPFYLVEKMSPSQLKYDLRRCANMTSEYRASDFSIGHRGAPLQFPEHTKESYLAAVRMGAGIAECDVSFTNDGELVCRHAQCDLHTTTNILATPLAQKCSEGFNPAEYDPNTGELIRPASAKCCTSDITLEEFRTLEGKMDASDPTATTVEEYLGGTAEFRTDLYTTGGTLLTHAESIELFRKNATKMTPELKGGDGGAKDSIEDVFGSQEAYAKKLVDEYREAGVSPFRVWLQSFNLDDVLYWIDNGGNYGRQAVFLDGRNPVEMVDNPPPLEEFVALENRGVNIIAPPMPTLLTTDYAGDIVPSEYAKRAREAGLDIISWTTERSGRVNEDIAPSGGAFYYNTTVDALTDDGDILKTIDVLAQEVGIIGLFSDWPATTTFYANCKPIPGLGGYGDDDGEHSDKAAAE